MKKWPALVDGDLIDIIAPGYAVNAELVQKAQAFLSQQGFRSRVPTDLLQPQYFHANSDERRWEHLKAALLSKESKAVWCLRGGYGSNRLLPDLAGLKKPVANKVLIGISDITSLHLFLNQKWEWITLHASLLDRMAKQRLPETVVQELFSVLRGQKKSVEFTGLEPLNAAAKKKSPVKGEVIGGNITVLQSTLGTPWSPKLAGKLLFLEDTGERGYRIDRMLEQFRQAKVLVGCHGVLFGHLIGGEEMVDGQPGPSRCREAIERFAAENPKLPVWAGVESGHDEQLRTLPLGAMAIVENKQGSVKLTVETGGMEAKSSATSAKVSAKKSLRKSKR